MKKANTKIKSLKVKSFTTKEAKKIAGGSDTLMWCTFLGCRFGLKAD